MACQGTKILLFLDLQCCNFCIGSFGHIYGIFQSEKKFFKNLMKSKPQLLILRKDSIFSQTFFKCLIIFKSRKVAGFFQWQPFEILMHMTLDWHDIISLHFIFPFFSKSNYIRHHCLHFFSCLIHFTEVFSLLILFQKRSLKNNICFEWYQFHNKKTSNVLFWPNLLGSDQAGKSTETGFCSPWTVFQEKTFQKKNECFPKKSTFEPG